MVERGTPKGARSLSELLQEKKEWKHAVGQVFAATRAATGQSQETFAASLEISQPYLSQIENGFRTPSENTLRKLQDLTEGVRRGDTNK